MTQAEGHMAVGLFSTPFSALGVGAGASLAIYTHRHLPAILPPTLALLQSRPTPLVFTF
jgi:hypothetical protein